MRRLRPWQPALAVGALVAGLFGTFEPVRAAEDAIPCAVSIVQFTALSEPGTYSAKVGTSALGPLDARLTFFTATQAFAVDVTGEPLIAGRATDPRANPGGTPLVTPGLFFRLPVPDPVQSVEVELRKNGAAADCQKSGLTVPDAGSDATRKGVTIRPVPDKGTFLEPTLSSAQVPACATPYRASAITHSVQPNYPEEARRQGQAGTVLLALDLTPTGKVAAHRLLLSSGASSLDAAALRSAEASTYTPEIFRCAPVAGTYTFKAEFGIVR